MMGMMVGVARSNKLLAKKHEEVQLSSCFFVR